MAGVIYNIDALRSGLQSIDNNIKALEAALNAERKKREEYLGHIAKAQAILDLHGVTEDGGQD